MSTGKPAPRSLSAADKAAVESAIDKVARRIKDLRNFDLAGIQERWDPRIEALQKHVQHDPGRRLRRGHRAVQAARDKHPGFIAGLDVRRPLFAG